VIKRMVKDLSIVVGALPHRSGARRYHLSARGVRHAPRSGHRRLCPPPLRAAVTLVENGDESRRLKDEIWSVSLRPTWPRSIM
jgi:hypothetical protein